MIADLLERANVLSLTTTGRASGTPHTVELWFVYVEKARAAYLLSYPGTDGRGTDWYKNALAQPEVTLTVRGDSLAGRVVPAPEKGREKIEAHIRELFTQKYGRAMISHYYGDQARLPLKIELADLD